MSTWLIVTLSILGFLSVVGLVAAATLFLYVTRELLGILDWLRDFSRTYLGLDIPEKEVSEKSKPGGFVNYPSMWDESKDGQD